MADPTYRPLFQHADWFDNVDPVLGAGSNGFNVRFDAIAGDLRKLSTVVEQIDDAIDALADGSAGAVIGREPVILVPLDLQSTPSAGPPPVGGWTYDVGGVAHPATGAGGGKAVMGVALPNGIRITSFRAMGGFEGGSARLVFQLGRARLNLAAQAPDILATLDSSQRTFGNPYDVSTLTDKALSTVDLAQFRYFVSASATSVSQDIVTGLAAIQLGFVGRSTD